MYSPGTNYVRSAKYPGNDCVEVDTGYSTPCWIWRKAKTTAGYGMVTISRRQYYIHVLNYVEQYGVLDDGLELDHKCRVRACCRPDHLEAVTHAENCRRGLMAKLTMDEARTIRELRKEGHAANIIASLYGVDASVVTDICAGNIWKEDT